MREGGRGPKAARRPARGEGAAPGLADRKAAARAVAAALGREATLDEALAGQGESPLARAIAVTTFRRFGTILDALSARLAKGLPRDPEVMAVLATGAAQILFLDTADHAAVDLAVRVARGSDKTRHLSGMVNAVLRRIAREREEIRFASSGGELPDWLAARWRRNWGETRTDAIAAAQLEGAALDLTCRSDPAQWAERLGGILLPTGSVRILDRRPVIDLPGFSEGAFWVQDAAAAIPARLLRVEVGQRVLDLCAAPGGKTAQLASAGAVVTALDRSEPRLARLRTNLARLGLKADVVQGDALSYRAEELFDAVLLDAPCTATGTLRRHPDIGWTRSEEDIRILAGKQAAMLDRAADLVRPGGRLVYCVCSLEPEEGEFQARSFLARHPQFRREAISPGESGIEAAMLTPEGDLRTAPDLWTEAPGTAPEAWRSGLDGFYAVRLVRTG